MAGINFAFQKTRLDLNPAFIKISNNKTGEEEEIPAETIWPPNELRPQLFLVEKYTLRSFKGDLARDQIIGSFSLTPHAKLTYNIFTKTATKVNTTLSTTVMENQNKLATSTFNSNLKTSADARFGKNNYNYQMDANFHGEAEWGIDSGSVDADVHAQGSTQEVRNELANSTQSAIDSQVAATDELRTQRTATDEKTMDTETVTESRMVKEIVNDSDEPENIGVFQLKEEIITLLCLTDVLIGFKNTDTKSDRLVSVKNIDSLLNDVIESPDDRAIIKNRVKFVLENITDYGDEVRKFVKVSDTNPESFEIDKNIEFTYDLKSPDGAVRRTLKVKGIIIRDYQVYVKKPNTTVELPINPV